MENQRTQSTLVTSTNPNPSTGDVKIVKLRPREGEETTVEEPQQKPERRVVWATETVDNEHMNRKKSNSKLLFNSSLLYLPSKQRSNRKWFEARI